MNEVKLLACPFCGHSAIVKPHDGKMIVECDNYGCHVKPFAVEDSEAEAAAAWNTRTKPIKRVRSRILEKENRADS